jgi:hypothetical protein
MNAHSGKKFPSKRNLILTLVCLAFFAGAIAIMSGQWVLFHSNVKMPDSMGIAAGTPAP